jgi:hypothetical protein
MTMGYIEEFARSPSQFLLTQTDCEQDGKYLQRGAILAEINLCQNLIGATSSFLTDGHQHVL